MRGAPLSRDAREPPPKPRHSTSGMRKLVRTPPMPAARADSLGKPFSKAPMSVVVPPMSATRAFFKLER